MDTPAATQKEAVAVVPEKPTKSEDTVKASTEEVDSAKMAALVAENADLKRRLAEMRASMLDHPTDDEEDRPSTSSLKRKVSEVVSDTDPQTALSSLATGEGGKKA